MMERGLSLLLEKAQAYLPKERLGVIEAAYSFAALCHDGQQRLSGEPFLAHPMETALLLADLKLDAHTLAAALLHDVPEDCGVSIEALEEKFGPEVAQLVDGTTKLSQLPRATGEALKAQAESLRKMLVAMARDIRVVLIKLADRLHNLRTLDALPEAKRRAIAQETLEIYAPLAHRLGIWEFKWQMEDLAFRYLDPEKYREVEHLVASKREERDRFIEEVMATLRKELEQAGLKAEVTGRPKHFYSIYQKMQSYASQGKEFSQIYDILALRVLVPTVQDCYSALGAIHQLWHPLPAQFDDYIANPKENLYQSLHSTVMVRGTPLELQIRTFEMHWVAEYGVASHWRYKEGGGSQDILFAERMTWLRQLLEWHREVSGTEEFLQSVKTDIFKDQVFVYTPKGDVKELPAGATPIDFAYRIHTDLGNRCVGARVNGRLVPLSYQLQNGDTVEIISAKGDRGPSLDWLNLELGYVKTSTALARIRQWFKRQAKEENAQRGRDLLERELKHLGLTMSLEEVSRLLNYENVEDFLAAVGSGAITPQQITAKLEAREEALPTPSAPALPLTGAVQVMGVGDLLSHLALCCHPLPGDDIIGFVTRTRGISVHRKDCPNIINEEEKERLVEVAWAAATRLYPTVLCVEAWDRVGLLRDLTTVVAAEKVNISSVSSRSLENGMISIYLGLETTGLNQLTRLINKLEGVKGVTAAMRTAQKMAQD